MYPIEKHPILDIPQSEVVEFLYNGRMNGESGIYKLYPKTVAND